MSLGANVAVAFVAVANVVGGLCRVTENKREESYSGVFMMDVKVIEVVL